MFSNHSLFFSIYFLTRCSFVTRKAQTLKTSLSFVNMFSKMPHTPMTVITIFTLIGLIVSQDPPPTIYGRTCYVAANAPVEDCQMAIDILANLPSSPLIDGPTTGCLETVWSGNCGIYMCSDGDVRPQSIAATAQDIYSGCRSTDTGNGASVGGLMTMSGFATSNITISMRTRAFGAVIGADGAATEALGAVTGSKRSIGEIDNTPPTRIHAKDLSIPHRVEARDPAPTWLVEGVDGCELRLLDSQTPGWAIDPGLATTLATNLVDNWNFQNRDTHYTAYNQQTMGAGTTVANGYYARNGYDLDNVQEGDRIWLATALHQFRNALNNPGWFVIQVVNDGNTIGDMFFDVGQAGGNVL